MTRMVSQASHKGFFDIVRTQYEQRSTCTYVHLYCSFREKVLVMPLPPPPPPPPCNNSLFIPLFPPTQKLAASARFLREDAQLELHFVTKMRRYT